MVVILKEVIKENILKKESANYYNRTYGKVTNISDNNTCSVLIQNQHGQGTFELEDVPIFLNSIGTHLNQIKVGDMVDVDFTRRSILSPKVVSVHYEYYEEVQNEEGHLGPSLVLNVLKEDVKKTIPMLDLYTKGNNKNSADYYKQINPIDEVYEMCDKVGIYDDGEIGITSRHAQSTVKVTKNGDILISVDSECNLSINKNDKTITINSCGYNVNCNGKVNINCNDEISLKTNKNITMDCDNLVLVANEFIHHDKR